MMHRRFSSFAILLLSSLTVTLHILAQTEAENSPRTVSDIDSGAKATGSADAPFIVAGYIPDYQLAHWSGDVDSLTDLIYFGASVSKAGRLVPGKMSPEHAQRLKKLKTAAGTRLLFTVGGWNKSEGFATLTSDADLRAQFIRDATAYCIKHGFDGIDYDWEHPKGADQIASYAQLLTETQKVFSTHKLIVTVAIAGWQDLGREAFAAVDRVHLMSYDHDFPHATMDKSQADVARLLKAGCPADKIVLGIPFYGRNKDGQTKSYAQLSHGKSLDSGVNLIDGYAFNGGSMVAQKVKFARTEKLAGVMIWELGQDASGANTLLKRIANEVKALR